MILGRLNACHSAVKIFRRLTLSDGDIGGCWQIPQSYPLADRWNINLKMSTTGFDASPSSGAQPTIHRNRLALERSPYLLQHASNPVDWYPWCTEAFAKAKAENKMIFLSIGYSTCHWCHVMEKESFEDEDIAKVMNDYFVSIKVDREERPDVDKIYMTFVQASKGGGGWPLNVWLTPELKPVFGGTYYPPKSRYGVHGFKTILEILHTQWVQEQAKLEASADKILQVLNKMTAVSDVASADDTAYKTHLHAVDILQATFDKEYGGFGSKPKFPQPVQLMFLLSYSSRRYRQWQLAQEMCFQTLRCMVKGGIHDHVGQGFARYSTDERWHVPHFEKMLYDQGQLAEVFATAYSISGDRVFERTLRGILSYVDRELSHEDGGFFSAEDADSLPSAHAVHKKEGAFYVWSYDEVQSLLTDAVDGSNVTLADLFCYHYNVRPKGNVPKEEDHHDEFTNVNVLYESNSSEDAAEKFNLAPELVTSSLERAREMMFQARLLRPRPHLDDKMVAAWNGLMITGYARASQALLDKSYEARAVRAAQFLKRHLYDEENGTLRRSCYTAPGGGVIQLAQPIPGFLEDYAMVIRALLDLYETCFEEQWLAWAERLQDKQDELFWDGAAAGYFNSAGGDDSIVLRLKDEHDGAEPSGNSVSASNLLRLASYFERGDLEQRAQELLRAFNSNMSEHPLMMIEMVSASMTMHDSVTQVFVQGDLTSADTRALLDVIHTRHVPGRALALVDATERTALLRGRNQAARAAADAGTTPARAHVCQRRECTIPTADLELLASQLEVREAGE